MRYALKLSLPDIRERRITHGVPGMLPVIIEPGRRAAKDQTKNGPFTEPMIDNFTLYYSFNSYYFNAL
jgi:hypothetical protein